MIRVKDIHKSYGKLEVLKGIDLHIEKASVVGLVGASGAGKSTLLHIIGTLDDSDKGSVWINEQDISKLKAVALARFRNKHIGFVFQFHHLLPEFTAIENIGIPAFIGGAGKKETMKRAEELLDFFNIRDRAGHKPNELSGGEQQRVAVARALINRPDIILADEPSGNLDSANAAELHRLFFSLREQFQQTFLIATHNEQLAGMTDRILRIKDGKIVA